MLTEVGSNALARRHYAANVGFGEIHERAVEERVADPDEARQRSVGLARGLEQTRARVGRVLLARDPTVALERLDEPAHRHLGHGHELRESSRSEGTLLLEQHHE